MLGLVVCRLSFSGVCHGGIGALEEALTSSASARRPRGLVSASDSADMSDLCRLCSSQLRGSRRKWLFGGSGSLPALFSHVLGTQVLRNPPGSSPRSGKGKGRPEDAEFICGKCCHSLNVYHRYDQVLSRMRELYEQRSIRLVKEKEKLSFTLRTIHARAWGLPAPEYLGHLQDRNAYGSLGSLSSGTPSKSYQNLLDHDRSMWEHESWWDDHHRGCSRCIRGEKCHSCSSWRVSDANYESVCTVPRRKKHGRSEDDGSVLLRSKSLGSVGGESTSSKGSLLSLSASSLDSLSYAGEEGDGVVFWEAKSPLASSPPSSFSLPKPMAEEVLKSLKEIKYSPIKTPTKSKIPIRGQQRVTAGNVEMHIEEDYERPQVEEPVRDIDAYMGIGPEVKTSSLVPPHPGDHSAGCVTAKMAQNGITESSMREGDELALLKRQRETEQKRLQEELTAREEDIAHLSKVLRDNQDIITGLSPSFSNAIFYIIMEALRDILGEKDFTIQRLEVALDSANRSAASQDALRLSALREKDALIAAIQGALSSSNQDVEALADSLLSQGLDDFSTSVPGFSAPNPLVSQIQEKGRLLSQAHAENQRQSVQHQRDIQDLLNALNESQTLLQARRQWLAAIEGFVVCPCFTSCLYLIYLHNLVLHLQEQLQHCKKRLQDGAQEQKMLRESLRVKEGEVQEERRRQNADRHQVQAKLLQLQDSEREKDRTTKKLLQDAENRDQIIKKLQERLSLGGGMMGTL
ncbi:unnamed protein product [Ranitomeya imitator]|uniref:ZAD domain-containing protein n=1 Tax=Ranitomeya imitator TaxID=111125 RepID=A0ABN9LSJ4_9NEOB|nr:unnamed protein product [Ranitomeya imitator]